jgi:hypothetical protein
MMRFSPPPVRQLAPAFAVLLALVFLSALPCARAQSISAGTVAGTVADPSGAAIPGANVTIRNPVSNYQQAASTDQNGAFRFVNVPLNNYHLLVQAPGFANSERDVPVRTNVPVNLNISLAVAGAQTSIDVVAEGIMVENAPVAHNSIDQNQLMSLPVESPGNGLSAAITLSTPGVVADSNGFFHPLGDHAQTSYVIDGQPISDQQSKAFSTQMPVNAIQSMELVTGMPSAQYGDKTSLVVDAATKSGLGRKPFGSVDATYGSFGELSQNTSFGFGSAKFGNFTVFDADRSGRFLDSPEFFPVHDIGNNETFFDRLDFQPTPQDVIHLDLFGARNWFQIPNSYTQAGQDQRQRVLSFNIAPGYQHTFGGNTLFTINPWVRRDFVDYYPSRDVFLDAPATLSQDRHLFNYGVRADVTSVIAGNTLKAGTELKQTRLFEEFSLGITDFTFNPVCVDVNGSAAGPATLTNTAGCAPLGLTANPGLMPGLVPFDLTRGGTPFHFRDTGKINEYAVYFQDSYTYHNWSFNGGLRLDQYNGLTEKTGIEPRFGGSYMIKRTATVLRASYSRTMETPYNENLLLSSASGVGGLASNVFGAFGSTALQPGIRTQYNAGLQQSLGKYLILDAGYFWRFTNDAYDFDVLFDTPITFPISWRKSKIDGVSGRIATTSMKGFQAQLTFGHTRARFFGPETGGLIFNSPVDYSVFRIDHDEAYEQSLNVHYQRSKKLPWLDFIWRYDSGAVAGNVPDLAAALALTGDQQAAIGFYCGTQTATLSNPITSCSSSYGASRVVIPKAGTFNPDTNPPRIAPRHVLDASIGTDNLLNREPLHMTLRFSVLNLTNTESLYNFLSTFSGTHFVTPRRYQITLGMEF